MACDGELSGDVVVEDVSSFNKHRQQPCGLLKDHLFSDSAQPDARFMA